MTARNALTTAILLATSALGTSCKVISPSEINDMYRDVLRQRHSRYQLKEGDSISIQLYQHVEDSYNQPTSLVLPDGRSDLFYMHDVELAGKSIDELEKELRARMVQRWPTFDTDNDVRIQVIPREESIYMVGEFARPGIVPLTSAKLTLHEAISHVGGLRITGDTDWALLRRPFGNPLNPALFRIDLNDESEELLLLPGDQIVLGRTALAGLIHYIREYVFGPLIPVFQVAGSSSALLL